VWYKRYNIKIKEVLMHPFYHQPRNRLRAT
jgi:hypothetical protein